MAIETDADRRAALTAIGAEPTRLEPPGGGAAITPLVLFEAGYAVSGQDGVLISGAILAATCCAADVVPVTEGWILVHPTSGERFEVMELQPDGIGMMTLRLEGRSR